MKLNVTKTGGSIKTDIAVTVVKFSFTIGPCRLFRSSTDIYSWTFQTRNKPDLVFPSTRFCRSVDFIAQPSGWHHIRANPLNGRQLLKANRKKLVNVFFFPFPSPSFSGDRSMLREIRSREKTDKTIKNALCPNNRHFRYQESACLLSGKDNYGTESLRLTGWSIKA